MKKIALFTILLLFPINILALNKDKVELFRCVDGDTARFILNKQEIKVRFLGIDAPESAIANEEPEKFGKEASNYTCNKLKKAKKIILEYEENAEKTDKYGRVLAYVFIDDKLLEEQIVKNGYAKVKYINSNYKYYNELILAEAKAIKNKKGIYSDKETIEEEYEEKITKFVKKYIKKLLSNILEKFLN